MTSAIFEVTEEIINGESHIVMEEFDNTDISMSELDQYAMELESMYDEDDLRYFAEIQDAKASRRMMR